MLQYAYMLVHYLRRIPEFSALPASELQALAAKVHVLSVPPGRRLIRSGRDLSGYFYLLKGCVETTQPCRRIRAQRFGVLSRFYPGCISARTLSAVQVIRIQAAHYEFLTQAGARDADLRADHGSPWLERFLGSHMMRHLPNQDWQMLLTSFKPQEFAAGDRVLHQGAPASECFVIESGHAVVHNAERSLCHLGPGDFFGEDGLVLGGYRNAHVSALDDLRVQAIDHEVFARALLNNLVHFVVKRGRGVVLRLSFESAGADIWSHCHANASVIVPVILSEIRRVAETLDLRKTYYVDGGTRRERALCALLLVQRGFRVYPLEDPVLEGGAD